MSHFQLHHIAPLVLDVDAKRGVLQSCTGLGRNSNRVVKAHIRWCIIDDHRTVHLIGGDSEGQRPRQFATHIALATQQFDMVLGRLRQQPVTFVNLEHEPGRVTTRSDGVRRI